MAGRFRLRHPAQFVLVAFAFAILVGTLLLLLPLASVHDGPTPFVTALFTATSAVCVTGLTVVDTVSYWSGFGQATILVLIQVGGFGIMTLASLLALLVSRRIGLKGRLLAQTETKALGLGDVRSVLVGVAVFSVLFESLAALAIGTRLFTEYDYPALDAAYHGVFHAVSAFNNAGFALYSDSLDRFVSDAWMSLGVAAAIVLGGLGFPVLLELKRRPRQPKHWTMHTKVTLAMTVLLLALGTLAFLWFEWTNPATLGTFTAKGKLLPGFFQSVTSRTAGFNTLDFSEMRETTWLITVILMFIGGGSASTAGGIKVTTFALLGFVIWAEARGEPSVTVLGRRLPPTVQRQAISVALLAVGVVVVSTIALMAYGSFDMSRTLFETVSAFATTGLSTGLTAELSKVGQSILIVLMFVGRLGPITVGTALALRQRERRYRLPEERPIIG
ncbi:MAG TPA: potassium transporter TrkG [Actinomycetota bacterium]|nr:potassium transporter TrkG [Actinomycetota bacterium]